MRRKRGPDWWLQLRLRLRPLRRLLRLLWKLQQLQKCLCALHRRRLLLLLPLRLLWWRLILCLLLPAHNRRRLWCLRWRPPPLLLWRLGRWVCCARLGSTCPGVLLLSLLLLLLLLLLLQHCRTRQRGSRHMMPHVDPWRRCYARVGHAVVR